MNKKLNQALDALGDAKAEVVRALERIEGITGLVEEAHTAYCFRSPPGLSAAQIERLALLAEELGEAQQAVGKILRYGYEKKYPVEGPDNREKLEQELGDVAAAIVLMTQSGDMQDDHIYDRREEKLRIVRRRLFHQPEQPK